MFVYLLMFVSKTYLVPRAMVGFELWMFWTRNENFTLKGFWLGVHCTMPIREMRIWLWKTLNSEMLSRDYFPQTKNMSLSLYNGIIELDDYDYFSDCKLYWIKWFISLSCLLEKDSQSFQMILQTSYFLLAFSSLFLSFVHYDNVDPTIVVWL